MKNVLIASVMLTGLAMGAHAAPLVVDITSSGMSGPTEDNTLSDRIGEAATYSATIDTDLSTADKEVRDDGATLVYGFASPDDDGNATLTLGSDMFTGSDAFLFFEDGVTLPTDLPDEIADFGEQVVDLISLESEFFYSDANDNYYVQAFGLFEATAFGITDDEVLFADGFDPDSPLATCLQITDVPFEDGSPNPDNARGFLSSSFSASFTLPDEKPDVAPVPLPASAWMLLAGLAGVGAIGRRAQKRKA